MNIYAGLIPELQRLVDRHVDHHLYLALHDHDWRRTARAIAKAGHILRTQHAAEYDTVYYLHSILSDRVSLDALLEYIDEVPRLRWQELAEKANTTPHVDYRKLGQFIRSMIITRIWSYLRR